MSFAMLWVIESVNMCGVQGLWAVLGYRSLSNPELVDAHKWFTTVAKLLLLLVFWSAFIIVDCLLIFCHFLLTKFDQGETFNRGIAQYMVLQWFTTHLTSKECSECIYRSSFVNIYCSRWTLLPDSECTDAIFHRQTKAHVCALWRHAAWPEGPFRRMTKQAWVLHEAQNGALAFVPWLQTPFSPLLHFWSRLYFSCIVIFFQPFCTAFPGPPLPAFLCEWVEGWMGMCESKGGRMTSTR